MIMVSGEGLAENSVGARPVDICLIICTTLRSQGKALNFAGGSGEGVGKGFLHDAVAD